MEAQKVIVGGLAMFGAITIAQAAAEAALNSFIDGIQYTTGKANTSLVDIGNGNISIEVPVTIVNNNAFGVSIDKFIGDVYYGAVYLSAVHIPSSFRLIPNEAVEIKLQFTVNINKTVQGVFGAASNGFSSLLEKIMLKGNIYILGGSMIGQVKVPIETAIDILP